MRSRLARWSTSPAAVLLGALVVSVLTALAATWSLELWHLDGVPARPGHRVGAELPLFLLGAGVVWLFVGLLVVVLGRLWLSVGIVLVVTSLLGFADRRKQELVTEPLYPTDLTIHTDAGLLSQAVGVHVVVFAALLALLAILGAVLLGRWMGRHFRLPTRRTNPWLAWTVLGGRVVLAAALVAALGYVGQFQQPGNDLRAAYDRFGAHWRPWHQSMNYTDNGVVGGMLYNLPVRAMSRPPGYSEATMRGLVEKYSAIAARANRSRDEHALDDVNVVVVLSESFSDPTRFGKVRLAEDPIPYTRQVLAETTSGDMLTEKYGGGTANVEFGVLTGMSTSQFRPQLTTPYQMLVPQYDSFPSAVRYFENQGLSTVALHSYTSALYRRAEVYPVLGFDEVVFEDSMTHRSTLEHSAFISDEATFQEVVSRLRAARAPTFMNVVTMQNHFPYAGKYDDPIPVTGTPNPQEAAELASYARGLRYSDLALESFLRSLRTLGEKTVVVFYGDHLPPVWDHSGMPPRKKHETPFFVYRNYGHDRPEQLPATSPIFMVKQALDLAGAPLSPYYALLDRLEARLPALTHDRYVLPDDRWFPWTPFPEQAREVLRDYRLVEYDLSVGRRYSEQAMFEVPPPPD